LELLFSEDLASKFKAIDAGHNDVEVNQKWLRVCFVQILQCFTTI
jgi:hypothetical protein